MYAIRSYYVRFLSDIGYPASKSFHAAAELALNGELKRAFQAEPLDIDAIRGTLYEAEGVKITLDGAGLGYTLRKTIERMMLAFHEDPDDVVLLAQIDAAVEMGTSLPFEVTFWKTQNLYWDMRETVITSYSIHYTKLYDGAPVLRLLGVPGRITSYNVCYTKLLRFDYFL